MIRFLNTEGKAHRIGNKRLLRRWLTEVARREGGLAVEEVTYIFCSAEYHRDINRQYLGHDYFTDIITFDDSNLAEGFIAGDIFIDTETVADNARIYGTRPLDELHRVVVHGVLHLCGQKDKNPKDEAEMHRKEDCYLALLEQLKTEK